MTVKGMFFKSHKPTKRIVEEIIVDSGVRTIFLNGKLTEEIEDGRKVGSLSGEAKKKQDDFHPGKA